METRKSIYIIEELLKTGAIKEPFTARQAKDEYLKDKKLQKDVMKRFPSDKNKSEKEYNDSTIGTIETELSNLDYSAAKFISRKNKKNIKEYWIFNNSDKEQD